MLDEAKIKQAQQEANESEEEIMEETANSIKDELEKEGKEKELEHHFYSSDERAHTFGFRDGIKITHNRNRMIEHNIELERDAFADTRMYSEMMDQLKSKDKERDRDLEKEKIKEHIRDILLKKKHSIFNEVDRLRELSIKGRLD